MDKVKRRSGSEKRQATVQRNLRFTPAHHAALCQLAEAQGQSLSALTLNALLDVPLPRTRHPKADDNLMRQFFTEIARARDALKPLEAELGKSGSNLNQITHVLNTDRTPESVMNILHAALQPISTRYNTSTRPSGTFWNSAPPA
jgi:Bacterial mobilisation protein (MobC)